MNETCNDYSFKVEYIWSFDQWRLVNRGRWGADPPPPFKLAAFNMLKIS